MDTSQYHLAIARAHCKFETQVDIARFLKEEHYFSSKRYGETNFNNDIGKAEGVRSDSVQMTPAQGGANGVPTLGHKRQTQSPVDANKALS